MSKIRDFERSARLIIQSLKVSKDTVKILLRAHQIDKQFSVHEEEFIREVLVNSDFDEVYTDFYYYIGNAILSLSDKDRERYGKAID